MGNDLTVFYQQAAHTLTVIGALFGLVAAWFWAKVRWGKNAQSDKLGDAPLWTAGALGFASLGYLLGRLTGTF